MNTPKIEIEFQPRGSDDKKPYVASVRGEGFTYHAQAGTPSEALLLVAAHWHSRAHMSPAG
jgi:hypothetical protein